ncbi:MAG: ATP-binding cassette domain-containing protein [Deltaproteobacteria bacterium]|nr:ATP-binding cassette domain-containing protein [Deltaproteobacteria bacterium]
MNEIPFYRITGLTYRYGGGRFLLQIPELDIYKGTSVGIVGPNGGGKTTFLKILALLEEPDEGTIFLNGKKVDQNDYGLKRSITMLLQEPYLLKRTVFENISYGLKVRKEKQGIAEKVHSAMGLVGLSPEEFSHRRWHQLSGGEAQRVALASRLILNPSVLILDEPTASVDQESAVLIKEAINAMREKYNTTLIVASHDIVWLNTVADKIYRVYGGRIAGYASDNIISGPWASDSDGLWKSVLPDGQVIHAATPPDDSGEKGLLDPSDIMISIQRPEGISAQNIIRGRLMLLSQENHSDKLLARIDIGGFSMTSRITRKAAESIHLFPGEDVFAVFKASSIRWQ